jgi:hypothetical protein
VIRAGGGGAYMFHVCGASGGSAWRREVVHGGELLDSINFLERDGSTSRWHIPFLESLASPSF